MSVFRLDPGPGLAPAVERLLAESRERQPQGLSVRERWTETLAGLALIVVCTVLAIGDDGDRALEAGPAIALTVSLALAARVQFDIGPSYTAPLQLIFVPMLFLLPLPFVPLVVGAGLALSRLADIVAGRAHRDRLLLAVADSWYAVGPVVVLMAAGSDPVQWNDAPIYLLAFLAQQLTDTGFAALRAWFGLGLKPRTLIMSSPGIHLVDLLLSPIGLLVAFVAADEPYRVLLVLPLLALFGVFAQERQAHIENALELSKAYRGTALLLGDVLEDKDAYTASHSHGVVSLSIEVGERLGLDAGALRRVEFGALLHDIGKIAVPNEIINKPGPLDDEEWAVMKLHTVEGQEMLDRVGGVLGEVGRVVRSSHEHWDGSGYPDKLAGAAIPIEARIVCACDAFSAMTTDRSYRKAMTHDAARAELTRCSGTQFDPRVVDALLLVAQPGNAESAPEGALSGTTP